jgi:thioredoxin reductase
MDNASLPVVVIGAGPVGLAAAVHLLNRGETPLVLEAGPTVGANIAQWAHVRVFSPWEFNMDPASRALLETHGWIAPPADAYPTGQELLDHYLRPLAALPEIQPHLRLGTRVTGVARQGYSRITSAGREKAPFVVRFTSEQGDGEVLARAVIDASGTYATPNPLGASGLPAVGERAHQECIFYGIPDVLGAHRARYAGRRVLVAGSGHSAFNALIDLATLAEEAPGTSITWVVRRAKLGNLFSGGETDQLPERGRLGAQLRTLVQRGALTMVTGYKVARIDTTPTGLVVGDGVRDLAPVDEIVVATGLRPDLEMLRELRLALDDVVESPAALAPLIDPNIHSCGSVPPHGAEELKHPETEFFMVGMKSYGRAPTFLLRTGYEQVRSVVLALTGDWEAARQIELVLPETGVCSSNRGGEDDDELACCAPAARVADESACCQPSAGAVVESACCGSAASAVGKTACCAPAANAAPIALKIGRDHPAELITLVEAKPSLDGRDN